MGPAATMQQQQQLLSANRISTSIIRHRACGRVVCGAEFDSGDARSSKRRGRRGRRKNSGSKSGGKGDAGANQEFDGLPVKDRFREPRSRTYSTSEIPHPMVASLLEGARNTFLNFNPQMASVIDKVFDEAFDSRMAFDYLEFRTYEIEGMGKQHIASIFKDFGYTEVEEQTIPEFKVTFSWLSPPEEKALPRIVISSLKMEFLSAENQEMIRRRLGDWPTKAEKHVSGAIASRATPWDPPTFEEYDLLYQESEFAAWVLLNGYGISCAAISLNEMSNPVYRYGKPPIATSLEDVMTACTDSRLILLNPADGDGQDSIFENEDRTIRQFSVLASVLEFIFADGQQMVMVGSYLSCVERSVLPEYKDEKGAGSKRSHLYDGFDAELMRKMMFSTALALPVTAQQLEFQAEVQKRAQMDGYKLEGDGNPEEEALVEKYMEIIMKEKEAEWATRN